ncbi:MAG: YceD family protein [Pseudomonadota bacterium]
MDTASPAKLKYLDLARAGAVIEREVRAADCGRLAEIVADLADGRVELQFTLDDDGSVHVRGTAQMDCQIDCHLCLSPQPFQLQAAFSGVVAQKEPEHTDDADVPSGETHNWDAQPIIVADGHLNVVELVEDELILHVPNRVCFDADCTRRPVMEFGPVEPQGGTSSSTRPEADNPFAVLRDLQLGGSGDGGAS